MECFRQNMVDIFFTHLIIEFTTNFKIRAHATFAKTVITSEKNFISQSVLTDISLNYFKQKLIASCKA
jgi:hypothetical protein